MVDAWTRRDFLAQTSVGLAAGLIAAAGLRAKGSPGKRPNILWIVSEDTGPEFGCYGYPLVHTPNVDRIAREGAVFTNAFTAAPVCSASRSGFMTGMYQTSIGAHNHRSHRGDNFMLPEGIHVFTKYFRDAGYLTALPYGKKTDWNFKTRVTPYDTKNWDDLKKANQKGQPFFAQVQFSETHRKFKHCKEHPVDPAKVTLPPYYPDHPIAQQDWALYLETINVLDQKIGQVLQRLEDDGLADNTIVIYFGDHGRAHVRGKQWLYDGGIHVPMAVRAPGLIEPGSTIDELVNAIDFAPTCLKLCGIEPPKHMEGRVFLGPGRDKPRDYIVAARDRCDETFDRIRCVRDKQYKYIRNFMPERAYTQKNAYKERAYPMLKLMRSLHAEGKLTPAQQLFMAETRPKEELFDIGTDPWEVKNLADSPKHQKVLETMRQRLDKWIQETGDKGQVPEATRTKKPKAPRSRGNAKPATGGKTKRLSKDGAVPRDGWKVQFVSSQETKAQDRRAEYVFDGKTETCWHTAWQTATPPFPHEIQIDLAQVRTVKGIQILPRQDRGRNGKIARYELYVAKDTKDWGAPAAKGDLPDSLDEQLIACKPTQGRYLRLVSLASHDSKHTAIAELNVLGE